MADDTVRPCIETAQAPSGLVSPLILSLSKNVRSLPRARDCRATLFKRYALAHNSSLWPLLPGAATAIHKALVDATPG